MTKPDSKIRNNPPFWWQIRLAMTTARVGLQVALEVETTGLRTNSTVVLNYVGLYGYTNNINP